MAAMLAARAGRLAAPMLRHSTTATLAACTATSHCKLPSAPLASASASVAAFSTRAAPLAASPAPKSQESCNGKCPGCPCASAPNPAMVATVAVAVFGLAVVLLDADEEAGVVSASVAERVRLRLRAMTSRSGVSVAECEAASGDMSRILASSRGPVAPAAAPRLPVVGEVAPIVERELASYWRRLFGTIVDQLFVQGVLMLFTALLAKARPGYEPIDSQTKLMIASQSLLFIMDMIGLTCFEGQTPGKWAMGTRVLKVNEEPVDLVSANILAGTRLVTSPITLFVEPLPLLTKSGRANKQFLHNALSGTVVMHETEYE